MALAPADRTKVVIRNLPPLLTEADARALVDESGFKDRATWFHFVQGKSSTKRVVRSHAYVNFNSPSDVFAFKAAVHGHSFVTDRGANYRCSVEYAPFQKVPKPMSKADPREGTVDTDADYLAFVEKLQQEQTAVAPKSILNREPTAPVTQQKPATKVTALVLDIQSRRASKGIGKPPKAASKDRAASEPETRRRTVDKEDTHRHSKDSASRKTNAKEGASDRRERRSHKHAKDADPDASSADKGRDGTDDLSRADSAAAARAAAASALGDPDSAELKSSREPRQVRMRAGFGVFQPSRVGRLLQETVSANEAASSSRSSRQEPAAANEASASSRPASRGSSTGADTPAATSGARTEATAADRTGTQSGNKGTKPTTAVAVAEALRGSPSKPKNKAKRTHTHDGAQGASATPEAAAAHAPGALPGTTSPQGPGSDRGVSPKILGIKKRVGTGTEAAMSSTGSAQAGTEGSGPSCLPPRVQPG